MIINHKYDNDINPVTIKSCWSYHGNPIRNASSGSGFLFLKNLTAKERDINTGIEYGFTFRFPYRIYEINAGQGREA